MRGRELEGGMKRGGRRRRRMGGAGEGHARSGCTFFLCFGGGKLGVGKGKGCVAEGGAGEEVFWVWVCRAVEAGKEPCVLGWFARGCGSFQRKYFGGGVGVAVVVVGCVVLLCSGLCWIGGESVVRSVLFCWVFGSKGEVGEI